MNDKERLLRLSYKLEMDRLRQKPQPLTNAQRTRMHQIEGALEVLDKLKIWTL